MKYAAEVGHHNLHFDRILNFFKYAASLTVNIDKVLVYRFLKVLSDSPPSIESAILAFVSRTTFKDLNIVKHLISDLEI